MLNRRHRPNRYQEHAALRARGALHAVALVSARPSQEGAFLRARGLLNVTAIVPARGAGTFIALHARGALNVVTIVPARLSIVVTPSHPIIPPTTPLGAVVATMQGEYSDGSPFTGTFAFVAPNYNAGGIFAISGNELIVNPSGPGIPQGGSVIEEDVTIEAVG